MDDTKRKRTGTRKTTMKVLEILKNHTSREHPISIVELVRRLQEDYEIHTSRDTVKEILADLVQYYPKPDKIRCQKSEKREEYTYHYYYETSQSDEIQHKIQVIQEVIRKNDQLRSREITLSFCFNGYGSDKQLHPAGRAYCDVVPLRICHAYGHPYLVCFFSQGVHPAHLRIDLMTQLHTKERKKAEDERRDFKKKEVLQGSQEEYLARHPYMFYERPGDITRHIMFYVEKIPYKPEASLTFLQDMFGNHWQVTEGTETDSGLTVTVQCLVGAAAQFVWQYMDRVRVLGPQDVKETIEKELREKLEHYFAESKT